MMMAVGVSRFRMATGTCSLPPASSAQVIAMLGPTAGQAKFALRDCHSLSKTCHTLFRMMHLGLAYALMLTGIYALHTNQIAD